MNECMFKVQVSCKHSVGLHVYMKAGFTGKAKLFFPERVPESETKWIVVGGVAVVGGWKKGA